MSRSLYYKCAIAGALLISSLVISPLAALAVDEAGHHHRHGDMPEKPVVRPKVYLDKSERIVWYQLNRLDNARLLLVEKHPTDKLYEPVYQAILIRQGMSPQYRDESLAALVSMNKSDAVTELLSGLNRVEITKPEGQRVGRQLATLILKQPQDLLKKHEHDFQKAIQDKSSLLRSLGYAGLIASGSAAASVEKLESDDQRVDWLTGIRLLPQAMQRNEVRSQVLQLVSGEFPDAVKAEAIQSLGTMTSEPEATFEILAQSSKNPKLRNVSIEAMLEVPAEARNSEISATLVKQFVELAEKMPAARRTSDSFLSMMQLTDQLLAKLPLEIARAFRVRLREVAVRVIVIHTVEEEMRYDVPYFAVEAGRPIQVVLKNEDLMPHNLVFTTPGSLQQVAEEGLAVGPNGVNGGKPYIPDSDQVMHATDMVQPLKQDRLTFNAPTEPGEYPYVCTFPRHWMRMYGVMVVVEDLEAWLQNPVVPKDPVGSDRSFVQAWKVEDFEADLPDGLRGRSSEIGKKLFKEATCQLCHQWHGEGGKVGPELTEVFKRWKGDEKAVLREILDPSYRIDEKYAIHVVATIEGEVISGMVISENATEVTLLDNPEAKEPRVIKKADIDEMVKTSKSMMPKALLDKFTKDEVLEILGLLQQGK